MSRLESFMETVKASGATVQPNCRAYRMDGASPDMRKEAGLGTCNCCDYVTFDGTGKVILIEETKLIWQVENLEGAYGDLPLPPEEVRKCVLRSVKGENKLKVYGSLLVLCRLARRLTDKAEAQALVGKADFWLVVSDTLDGDRVRFLDFVKGELFRDLRSVLTGAVVGDVEIVMASKLGGKLPPRPSLPVDSAGGGLP